MAIDRDAERRPRYIVFAGVNGAGKSTLFRSGLWHAAEGDAGLPRVNSDEILVAHGWDWADGLAQIRAGREAVRVLHAHLEARRSFNQETTLSGRTAIRTIQRAKALGYEVVMHYVGVESPAIANERIAHRVQVGGHDIAPEDVERRYASSMVNVAHAVRLCDEAYLFDNTRDLTFVAAFSHGALALFLDFPPVAWVHRALDAEGLLPANGRRGR